MSASLRSTVWFEDGVKRGQIYFTELENGQRLEYRDLSNRVVRIETRDPSGTLDPSLPTENYGYDSEGYSNLFFFTDSSGKLTLGPSGFALRRSEQSKDENGIKTLSHYHYDVQEQPTMIQEGYFQGTYTWSKLDRPLYKRYFDISGKRVSVTVGSWADVYEIRYAYLIGVTPIVMEILVDDTGTPLHKEKISGYTEKRVDDLLYETLK